MLQTPYGQVNFDRKELWPRLLREKQESPITLSHRREAWMRLGGASCRSCSATDGSASPNWVAASRSAHRRLPIGYAGSSRRGDHRVLRQDRPHSAGSGRPGVHRPGTSGGGHRYVRPARSVSYRPARGAGVPSCHRRGLLPAQGRGSRCPPSGSAGRAAQRPGPDYDRHRFVVPAFCGLCCPSTPRPSSPSTHEATPTSRSGHAPPPKPSKRGPAEELEVEAEHAAPDVDTLGRRH